MDPQLARLLRALSPAARDALRETPMPAVWEPMQPVPMEREDPGTGWMLEPLFDGTRCVAACEGGSLRLLGDGRRRIDARAPELGERLLEAGSGDFAIDGEILSVDPDAEQALVLPAEERFPDDGRGRVHQQRFLAFDLLHAAGRDLTSVALIERRCALRALLRFSPAVMYVRESTAPAELVFNQAEQEGWRGVVAKRADSLYVAGPSDEWRVWRRPRG